MTKQKIPFWRVFWPGLTAVIIGGLISIFVFFFVTYAIFSSFFDIDKSTLDVKENTILQLKLDGTISEKSSNTLSGLKINQNIGLSDILFGINKAKNDSRIKGILIELGNVECGISTANEIRDAILDFKSSGKFVISYLSGEYVSQKSYYISSAAEEIYSFPNSAFQWTGLGGEIIFFKGLLDKLDIDVEIIKGRDNHFKSAVEPFSLKKMSDSSKVQTKKFLNVIWNDMTSTIAKERGIDRQKLENIADSLLIRKMDDALKYKLTDSLIYKDELLDILAKKVGISNSLNIEFLSLEKYSKRFFYDQQESLSENKPRIAVLIAEGEITKNGDELSSKKICSLLRKIKKESAIKSVVLRINSPGGSALASEEIWRELSELKKEKEIVVSMGDVAASGGYYIATPAEKIFAESTTITGSIGVFGMVPYLGDFLQNKIGLTFDHVATNKHSIISLNRRLSKDELAITQSEVDDIYLQFLERVSKGRNISMDSVNQIARGRVWAGDDALKIGLVDQIGGLSDAIQYVAEKNNFSSSQVIYYPIVKRTFFDKLSDYIEDNKDDLDIEDENIQSEIVNDFNSYLKALYRLESMVGIQMRMPFELKIN